MDMMSLRRRIIGVEKTLLPREYQQVEYLESTGTQYIVTDVMPAVDLPFDCTFYTNHNNSPSYGNVFGVGKASNSKEYQLSCWQNGFVCVGARNAIKGAILPRVLNHVSFDGGTTVTINGTDYTINTVDDMHDQPIALFGIIRGTSVIQVQPGKIYHLSFGNVADFIPCYRKSDSVAGMYDLVSGEFYTNAGSGEFVVGEDV